MFKYFCVFIFLSSFFFAQNDIEKAREIIKQLTSKKFSGRGYIKNGCNKAGDYISDFFKEKKLLAFSNSYFQPFSISVNTFPGNIEVELNNKKLIPGIHYLINPESSGAKGKYTLSKKDSVTYFADVEFQKRIIIKKVKKLTWGVSTKVEKYLSISVLADSLKQELKTISINTKNKWIKDYQLKNVCGYIKGKVYPDSFIVFTAHYDHLGKMGKQTIFPGANDNASGVSMLFSLIDYYTLYQPDISIVFICFAAEEAGLLGSEYFTENPLFPLKKINFLINLDLLGTGNEGITVVNATEFKNEFEQLKIINENQKLLSLIKPRGKAANSDHYWFTEKGIPSFFIYTLGGISAYHDVFDIENTLPLTEFNDVKKLLIEFANSQMQKK
jgi:aminopeptidase YwaD